MADIRNLSLEPDFFYHIYNRGVNGESIFKSEENYRFFLESISKYLIDVCDVYAYALLPNHFHFLVKIKSKEELENLVKVQNLDKISSETPIDKGLHARQNIFSKHFASVFNSYTQAFNKKYNRHGPLIESPFKRKLIDNEEYLRRTIIYIHQNPQKHGVSHDFSDYKFTSYNGILSNSSTLLKRDEVIELFDNIENFVDAHLFEVD
jgi:REP element-mobilizing transposase RayT